MSSFGIVSMDDSAVGDYMNSEMQLRLYFFIATQIVRRPTSTTQMDQECGNLWPSWFGGEPEIKRSEVRFQAW